jgi:hypothetical protein
VTPFSLLVGMDSDPGRQRYGTSEARADNNGRPGIDPDAALRLMLPGFLLGVVHYRRLLWEAQVNIALRWFIGYDLHEVLPDHSSLTRIRQRWGADRFRRIFEPFGLRCQRGCVD